MKFRFPRSLQCALLLLASAAASPADDAASAVPAAESLQSHMDRIGTNFRAIRKAARDPGQFAECADLTAAMLADARASLAFEPPWKAEQPESEQDAFAAAYFKEMQVFIGLLEKLEQAFRKGDADAAASTINELRDHQKTSHGRFRKPDEE